jgi:hypothetical protein
VRSIGSFRELQDGERQDLQHDVRTFGDIDQSAELVTRDDGASGLDVQDTPRADHDRQRVGRVPHDDHAIIDAW